MSRKKSHDHDSNGPQMKKKFHLKDLLKIQPLTLNQKKLFDSWKDNSSLSFFLYGSAGTGKTFSAMFLALYNLLDENETYDKIIIIRSTVASRDVGFLPGDLDEKTEVYEEPYISICDELFPWSKSYENLKKLGKIEFMPTSFLRGTTFDNCLIIVDECQNMNYGELDTIITRVGKNSKIFFCGDCQQNDLMYKKSESSGFSDFKRVLSNLREYFDCIEFNTDDIVRSSLVKDYIIAKNQLYA